MLLPVSLLALLLWFKKKSKMEEVTEKDKEEFVWKKRAFVL